MEERRRRRESIGLLCRVLRILGFFFSRKKKEANSVADLFANMVIHNDSRWKEFVVPPMCTIEALLEDTNYTKWLGLNMR